MREIDVKACMELGVDAVGFVVEYPLSVPWNLGRERARELMSLVYPFVSRVLVTSGDLRKIVELVEFLKPDVLQLHGEEDSFLVRRIVKRLHEEGVRVIKALSVDVSGRPAVEDLVSKAIELQDCGIDALVLDSKTGKMPGGTGVVLDWEIARTIREKLAIPMILAGGLNPDNVKKAIRIVKPYGIDVLTGVEVSPGIKDYEKIKALLNASKP
jgi:phosphoribosylanthranilate isomerase